MFRYFHPINLINGFLIYFVFLQIVSCSPPSVLPPDRVIIEMEKTPCYGRCPVYTIQIDERGKGLLEGIENTPFTGLHSFRLSRKEVEGLKAGFERIGFFGLQDRYYDHVTDLPTTYLTYRSGSRKKKIMDYFGAPEELKSLEKQIETLVFTKKMKKIN